MFFYFIPITSHHWVKLVFQRHTKQFKTENVVVILIYQLNEECIEVIIAFVTCEILDRSHMFIEEKE